jgi:iron only hydrogenase large subunit-like protein
MRPHSDLHEPEAQRTHRLVFDTTFARTISLEEGQREWQERSFAHSSGKGKAPAASDTLSTLQPGLPTPQPGPLPVLASACPGWICYAEKTHGELLPFVSAVKSPQQVMGSLVKFWLGPKLGLGTNRLYHVSVMPCYDKKLEASREDFADADTGVRDVDCVLTTGEVQKMLDEKSFDISSSVFDDDYDGDEESRFFPSLLPQPGSSSGGYLHSVIETVIRSVPSDIVPTLQLRVRPVRGEDYVEYALCSSPTTAAAPGPSKVLFKGARCYGFRNLQNAVRKVGKERGVSVTRGGAGRMASTASSRRGGAGVVKRGGRKVEQNGGDAARGQVEEEEDRPMDFIEVMACPSGCVNGGGQLAPTAVAARAAKGKGFAGAVDDEGMPEMKLVADDDFFPPTKAVSAKDWVAGVEEVYWRIGGGGGNEPPSAIPGAHPSVGPYLPLESAVGDDERWQRRRKEVEEELLEGLGTEEARERRRRELWRTQYRAVQEDEVNGLAVKW